MSKFYRYVYLYVRYACIFYFGLFLTAVAVFILELIEPSDLFMNIFFIFFIFCIPAFMILPGLIYDDYKGAFHGFTVSQLKYSLFFGLTGGLGPIMIFFKEHDAKLKKRFQVD